MFTTMKIRRSLSALGIAATALAGVALSSGTASASSGGGCGITQGNVAACVSAMGSLVNYDFYVNYVPSNCTKTTETITDLDSGWARTVTDSCYTGHHGTWSTPGVNGHRYHTVATMWTTSGNLPSSVSPTLTFSN